MNKVEARLRGWSGNLRNGAYRRRVLEAAEEIAKLEQRNVVLVEALEWVAQHAYAGGKSFGDTPIVQNALRLVKS